MAKEIKFNIKLSVDGKEQLVTATTSTKELRKQFESAKPAAASLRDSIVTLNQSIELFSKASSAVNQLRDTLSGLTATYNAVQQSNTLLTTVMKQRINATEQDIKKVKEVISAQTELGVISGTVQRMGAQQIATFLKEKGTLETLIPAMNDLVAQQKGISATGEDARGVANLMGKAMMGQTSALRRVGITFTDAQERIMKFGDEQQRASMLAQIITDNVGHMNAALAKTDAGRLKQIEMSFGSIKAKLGELAVNLMPMVTFSAMALTTATSVITLSKSLAGCAAVMRNFSILTKATSVACVSARSAVVGLTAVTRVMRAAFTGATIGATTLKVAIKSLMISTGVGVAVWALTEAVSYLATSSSKATNSMDGLSEAEERAKAAKQQEAQQIAEITSALDINIAKLKAFKGGKEEEKKLVAEMNTTYGATIGYYSSVSQWYTALVGNSKAYCSQMINEVRIRDLANRAAELAQKRYDFTHDSTGKARKFDATRKTETINTNFHDDGKGGYYDTVTRTLPSELDKANAYASSLYKEEQALRKQMESLTKLTAGNTYKQFDGYSKTEPASVSASTTKGTTPKAAEVKTYVEKLQAQLNAAKKELENATTIDAKVKASAKVDDIQAQIDEATKGRVSIEADAEPGYLVQGSSADKRQSRANASSRISRIKQDYEIGIIGADEAKKQIEAVNAQLVELGVTPIEVQFKTRADELQEQLTAAKREFDSAATIDAKIKANAKVNEIQSQIDEATNGRVTIKADVEPSYIEAGSAADKRQSYANAQSKANRIQSDYEIGLIGKDEAQRQIEELNEQLEQLGLNLSKPFELDVDTKGFDSVMGAIERGWGGIQNVGNGIEGITDALEGNGDAWQQISGVINGVISIAQGIKGIVDFVNMLTAATQANTAATGVNTAITAANTTASATNTAAKSGEAIAEATSSGASLPFPANLVAIAAGVAAVVAALAMVSGFATGGVIGGSSTSGDKKFARVNSGEMILNKAQQARLFGYIEGRYQPPVFYDRSLSQISSSALMGNVDPTNTIVNVHLNANARKMLQMMSDTKRVTGKSGKTYSL